MLKVAPSSRLTFPRYGFGDLAHGLRGAVAVLVPMVLGRQLGRHELMWAALGGWLCTISDPGGARRSRAAVALGLALAGAVLVALGETAAPRPPVAVLVVAAVAFAASTLRAVSPIGAALATPLVVVTAIAVGTGTRAPLPDTLGFVAGVACALFFSSIVWPIRRPSAWRVELGGFPRLLECALSAHSASFRHGVRVAVAVVLAETLGRLLSPQHSAWVTVTTVAVLQPYPGATIRRAVERAVGTVLGVVLALAVIVTVRERVVVTLLLFALAVGAVATTPRRHPLFVFFLTPLFVVLGARWDGDWWTALVRLGDALLGAIIALGAATVLPTRDDPQLAERICTALARVRGYSAVALQARSITPELLAMRHDVAVVLEDAEASLARVVSAPRRSKVGAADALLLLTYARRLAEALTALGVAADEDEAPVVSGYVDAVLEGVVSGRKAPAAPAVVADALQRVVREAERVGSRPLHELSVQRWRRGHGDARASER